MHTISFSYSFTYLYKEVHKLDIKQLEYFVTIVDTGNISAAAKSLHMSQPPLSNQMKLLEEELGLTLFTRGSRHIQLTEAGRILYNKACILLELTKSTMEELDSFKKGTTTTLKIGIASSVGNIFLKKWILPFHKANPNIHYEIIEANTYELLEYLKTSHLDCALVRTPFPSMPFKSIPLLEEPLVAVGKKNYFLQDNFPTESTFKENADSITLSDLCHVPILLYRRWENILLNVLKERNLEWNIFCKNDDARTTLMWVNEGLGVGIVPKSATDFANSQVTIIKNITDSTISSSIALVYNPNATHSNAAKEFINFLLSQ